MISSYLPSFFLSFRCFSSLLLSTSFSILSVAIHKPWSPVESVSKPESFKDLFELLFGNYKMSPHLLSTGKCWSLISNLTTKFQTKNVKSLGHDRSQSIFLIFQQQVWVSSRPVRHSSQDTSACTSPKPCHWMTSLWQGKIRSQQNARFLFFFFEKHVSIFGKMRLEWNKQIPTFKNAQPSNVGTAIPAKSVGVEPQRCHAPLHHLNQRQWLDPPPRCG